MAKLVSKTYGEALFEAAVEDGTVDTMLEEVDTVLKVIEENEEYIKILNHPKIPQEERISIVEKAFKGNVSEILLGFFVTVVEKGRVSEIEAILEYFIDQVREYKKIGVAYVTSAKALSDSEKKDIEKKLLETTKYESFIMNFMTDEKLIGGLVIKIGDRVVDSSIKTKLNQISKELYQIQLTN